MNSKLKFKQTEIGLIPEDWEVDKIGNVAKFQYGLGESAEKEGDYVYLRITDISQDNTLNKTGLMYINKNKVKENYILSKGDVLVARTGATFGKTLIFNEDFKATYGGFLIKFLFDKNLINSRFFFHYTRSNNYWHQANNLVNGGAQPQFNANTISELYIPIPPIQEQSVIAKILSDLDSKIELLQKQNETLEKIGQAIFKQWFVDFEFPNEESNPYKSSGGKMVESELGEIPKGWSVGKLCNIFKIVYGKNLPTDKLKEDGFPVFGGNGLIGFFDKYIYDKPQVIIACRGAASGKINFTLPNSFVTNNSLIIENDNSKVKFNYLKHYSLNSINFEDYVTGSAQPQITIENLRSIDIMIPELNILNLFDKILDINEKKILLNQKEIKNLQKTRDLLLPKLMTGKIRVPLEVQK